jgi:hypothetical protein
VVSALDYTLLIIQNLLSRDSVKTDGAVIQRTHKICNFEIQ